MDLETANRLINSPLVQKYIENIDTDAQAALDEMDSNIGGMSDYPSHFISEYKADGAALDSAWGDFNAEWNKVVFGQAKDGKAAMTAYSRYVLTLGVLEEQNVRFGAYVEYNVAGLAAAFIEFFMEFLKRARKSFEELEANLIELEKLLKKAKKEVKEAEVQRIINVAITAVSLCVGPAGVGARIGVAAGVFTVQMVLDAALGPGDPGALGTINTAAGDAVGVPKSIKPKFAKLGSAATAVLTLKLDSDEVAEAKKIVAKIKERLGTIEKTMKTLERFLYDDANKLEKLKDGFDKALAQAKAAADKYKSAENERLGLLKEL
ncbi:MAG TPA: hypothetical protein VGK58_18850, partial [Lacipirellulaceae bacterium]